MHMLFLFEAVDFHIRTKLTEKLLLEKNCFGLCGIANTQNKNEHPSHKFQ